MNPLLFLGRLSGILLAMLLAAASTRAASCASAPAPGCLYSPPAFYAVDASESQVDYIDIAGQPRRVPIAIRRPLGAMAPLPVVIWSHGGAEGHRNPRRSVAEWSQASAQAGYLSISLAHEPRGIDPATLDNTRRSLCAALATASPPDPVWDVSRPATCRQFKYLNWDRPHDIRAVLDELERMNQHGPLRGQIDLERIALAGHSAGAGGALTVGGALRNFTGRPMDLSDPRLRAKALVALSPQQPGNEGFFDTDHDRPTHSWMRLRQPVLLATSDGDNTCQPLGEPGSCFGDMPAGRRAVFERLPAGDKYLLYFHDARVFHGLLGLETGDRQCAASAAAQQHCDAVAQVLRATVLAFLDAHLLARPLALRWLAGRDVEIASDGLAQWLSR